MERNPREYSYGGDIQFLDKGEKSLLMELIWSFIIEGLLTPGFDDSNVNLPFLRLTDYGKECLQAEQIIPHDPEGYLADFKRACPNADEVITQYLTEALQCYLRSLHRAAAVMLGAASEHAILLLVQCWLDSITDSARRDSLKNQVNRSMSIFKKFEIFRKHLDNVLAPTFDRSRRKPYSLLGSIFDLIRNSRNDAGHPARMADISRETNYAHLRLFVPYCRRIYALMDWFATNRV